MLIGMTFKLMLQKLGHAVILEDTGLNHFWENILALLAVSFVYLGVILAMSLKTQLDTIKLDLFAALTGMFLYLSLATVFPALQELVDEPLEDRDDLSDAQYHVKSRKQSSIR